MEIVCSLHSVNDCPHPKEEACSMDTGYCDE